MDVVLRRALAADAAAVSHVILTTLRVTSAQDYPAQVIEQVALSFGPDQVAQLIASRDVYLAYRGQEVLATASLDGNVVRSVFVLPTQQGQGIGQQLLALLEQAARGRGIDTLWVPSSVTAQGFYARLGFTLEREQHHGAERTLVMKRVLGQA
ncbi:GNAT family N-acetyltransferase [Pseudomonas sp. nanlin1]|uniref:GNAT family N-acetyltransferase n=1 Tax=Pseudomonas sp. nanlin1 TaxID=3040605 RepID=UPI00388E00E7